MQLTIGRVEIVVPLSAPPHPTTAAPAHDRDLAPPLSLADYLKAKAAR